MPPIPLLNGRKVVRVFEQLGWQVVRQRGSHIIMVKDGYIATLSIPDHKEVARGTLRRLINVAKITVGDFVKASEKV